MAEQKFQILIADNLAPECAAVFAEDGRFEVTQELLRGEDLLEQISRYHGLIVRSGCKVTSDVLSRASNLKAVARAGVGVDNIDIAAATKAGVLVMNTPGGNTTAAAEQTVTLILSTLRKTALADRTVRNGKWRNSGLVGTELRGKTVGVVGLGKIGREVVRRLLPFEVKVLGFDPMLDDEAAAGLGVTLQSLDEIFTLADIVTLHVPLTDKTRHLVNETRLASMKPGAIIVNCARGGIIDEHALANALAEKRLAGAGLDVFEQEPVPADHPLLNLDNAVLTPHLGASTSEAQVSVGVMSAQQIRDYLIAGDIKHAINTVALAAHEVEEIQPFVDLSRKIGSMHAQIGDKPPQNLKVTMTGPKFQGKGASERQQLIVLAVLEGFFSHFLSSPVNRVSVPHFAKEHGIHIESGEGSNAEGFESLIRVTVETADESRVLAGTLFGGTEPRLVLFDEHRFNAIPQGNALVFRNHDQPGVLGSVASFLGEAGVNISNVTLGCLGDTSMALAFLNIDSDLSKETLNAIEKLPGLPWARFVTFK